MIKNPVPVVDPTAVHVALTQTINQCHVVPAFQAHIKMIKINVIYVVSPYQVVKDVLIKTHVLNVHPDMPRPMIISALLVLQIA
jgi:hypothetical protein